MKTLWKYAAALCLVAGSSAIAYQKGASTRSSYTDENYGFSIETPRYPGAGPRTPGMVLMVPGPPSKGFAPNLNITVQDVATTTKDYLEMSLGQFPKLGWKVNTHRELKVSGRDAIEIDYEGEAKPGQKMHFLAVAVIEKDRVILATATVLAADFAEVEAELRASLASLKLK
ncbi:hypothetical protein TA3x_004901 [Tundrisphaera sp. TA3]|uniref:hypothetical protein n=1 Tax=Tundrisphaera sp. TA3 TaxID=3435775 RepID=UPI003EB96D04